MEHIEPPIPEIYLNFTIASAIEDGSTFPPSLLRESAGNQRRFHLARISWHGSLNKTISQLHSSILALFNHFCWKGKQSIGFKKD